MRHVYILRCNDNSLYTGITTDLERRIIEHNSSTLGARYTKSRRPVALVWSTMYDTRQEASSEEWRVKKLSKQEKELMVEVFLSNTEYAGPHTATSP